MSDASELLCLRQVADMFGVGPFTVMVWVLKGTFPQPDHVFGCSNFWSYALVEDAIAEGIHPVASPAK